MIEKNKKYAGILVAAGLMVVYLLFPTKNYYWDGIEFAQTIEDATVFGATLFHPNHLVYNIVGYALYELILSLGIEVRALTVLIAANSVMSAIAAFVFFQVCLKLFKSVQISVLLTIIFGFSATWWKFSTDANSYIPSILFSLLAFYFVLPGSRSRPFAVAILHSISMCFHQLSVFMFPVLIVGLLMHTSAERRREFLLPAFKYSVTAFALTFGSYWAAYNLQTNSSGIVGLFGWLTSFSPENGFLFNLKDCIKHTIGGDVKLLFGGRLNFIKEVIGPFTAVLSVIGVAALSLLLVRFIKAVRARSLGTSSNFEARDWMVWTCGAWLLIYHLFLFVWIPQNTFYRMFYLPPFVILLGYLFMKLRIAGQGRQMGLIFSIVLFCVNFLFLIYPYTFVRKETPLELALKMNEIWSDKSVVHYSNLSSDNRLIKYFNPQVEWRRHENFEISTLEANLYSGIIDGEDAWLETTAIDKIEENQNGSTWLNSNTEAQTNFKINDPAYNVEIRKVIR